MKKLLLRARMKYGFLLMDYERWCGRFGSARYLRGVRVAAVAESALYDLEHPDA